jgi:hypothetical protein
MNTKLDKLSFEQFVTFVFDHPVTDVSEAWYWEFEQWEWSENNTVFEHLIMLFHDPEFLLEAYTTEELEQGFWFMKGPSHGFLETTIWNPVIPWPIRKELILSMGELFEKLFANNSLGSSSFMWWHTLANDFSSTDGSEEIERPGRFPNDPKVQQAIFETLCRILRLPSKACQKCALHGMGHLRHADTKKVISEYLSMNPEVEEELKKYAISCMSGERIE